MGEDTAPLDPVALFLQHLSTHGFQVGTRDLIQAHTLWVALAARRELPVSLHERLALLRPLLCRTPAQQREFPGLLAQWSPPAEEASAKAKGWRARHRARVAAGGTDRPAPESARWRWPLAVAVAVGALLLSWPHTEPGVPTPDPGTVVGPPVDPPPAAEEPAADTPGPLPTVQPPGRSSAWLRPVGALGVLLAGLLVAAALLRRVALQPLRTDRRLDQRTLFGEHAELVPRGAPVLRLVSRELRRPRSTDRLDLDIPKTIAATVREGGAFAARHRARRSTPEYLVLIERRGAHDQLARLAEEIAGVLVRQGVAIDLHRYAGDPASVEPARLDPQGRLQADPAKRRLRLAELLSRSPGQRLLLFGEAAALFDPVAGGLREGLGPLPAFGATVLFTPLPVPSWGDAEHWLGRHGVLVLPLQLLALASAADWLVSQRALLSLDPDWPATYPPRLRRDPLRWVAGDTPPAPAELDGLLFELQVYLGRERLQWLCGCATFPVPSWSITVALQPLFGGAGRDAVAGGVALAALPWFREGRWPLWLRDALQQRLDAPHREAVSAVIQQRLRVAALHGGKAQTERLAEVATAPGWRGTWARFATGQWLRRAEGALRRDVLFLGAVQRGMPERWLLRVPERLRRLLFREGLPLLGMRAWVPALAAGVAATGLALQLPPVRAWAEARLGDPAGLPTVPPVTALDTDRAVQRAAFSPDGQLVATAGSDGVVVWRRDGAPLATLRLPGTAVESLAFEPDGAALRVRTAGDGYRWRRDGTVEPGPRDTGERAADPTAPDGATRYRIADDGSVRIESVADGRPVAAIPDAKAVGAEFAPSGRQIVTIGAAAGGARLWGERLPVSGRATWRDPTAAAVAATPLPIPAPTTPVPPASTPPAAAVVVPDFIGQDADTLVRQAARRARNLELATRDVNAPDFCRGLVIAQAPARGASAPAGQVVQLEVAENTTAFYPLLCRGGPREVRRSAAPRRDFTRIEFEFVRGTAAAGQGLVAGQCSWLDRGFRDGEPGRLQVDVGAAALRALRPLLTSPTGFVRFSAQTRGNTMRAGCGEVERQPPPLLEAAPPIESAAARLDARVNEYFGYSRSPQVMQENLDASIALATLLARRGLAQPEVLALGLAVAKLDGSGAGTPTQAQQKPAPQRRSTDELAENLARWTRGSQEPPVEAAARALGVPPEVLEKERAAALPLARALLAERPPAAMAK